MFDGHDGSKVSKFAAQRMPAELLLGQLTGKTTDDAIQDVLVEVSLWRSVLPDQAICHMNYNVSVSWWSTFRPQKILFWMLVFEASFFI